MTPVVMERVAMAGRTDVGCRRHCEATASARVRANIYGEGRQNHTMGENQRREGAGGGTKEG